VQEETDQLQLVDGMAWVNFFFYGLHPVQHVRC